MQMTNEEIVRDYNAAANKSTAAGRRRCSHDQSVH